jgi:hypothetical protein
MKSALPTHKSVIHSVSHYDLILASGAKVSRRALQHSMCQAEGVLTRMLVGRQASEELQAAAVEVYDQDTGPFPLSDVQVR